MKNLFIEAEHHRRRLEAIQAQLAKQGIYDPLDIFQVAHLLIGYPITTKDNQTYTITKIINRAYKTRTLKYDTPYTITESIIYIKPQNGRTMSYATYFHDKKPNRAKQALQAIEATLLAEWITKPAKTPALDAIEAGLIKYHKSNS